jgi:hypothetical protein
MLPRLRRHKWSQSQRAVLISVVAVVMGSLFVTTYSLALGDPVPHHIKAALVGDPDARPRAIAEWAILTAHVVAVSSFASVMTVLLDAWAIVSTWLFFVILGNASSGAAVAPALLPQPFAFLSQWLPSGATVSALRNAIYFRDYQLARPLLVLGIWATALFVTWISSPAAARPKLRPPSKTRMSSHITLNT